MPPTSKDDKAPVLPASKDDETTVLQGKAPPTSAADRALVLRLLRTDPEVRLAVRALVEFEPDAAMGNWIKTLIEETQRQTLRRDVFRRP